uniref:Cullin 9 n=1 Tax=Cyprinus carpio TaxID=7962 RepID=A0A8C1T9K0_CYPCA
MVGERRNGNLLVQLGPALQAYPEELIRQRRTHDGQTEYLIRWSLSSGGGGSSGSTSGESKTESILMWMSTEDVYANCPTLLGKRKNDPQRPLLEEEERPSGQFPADVTFDEGELLDMKDDVKNLVRRARKQMAKNSDFGISITHTIHVLSAYASIGSLVGVFKETGALDLLMELLCNKERQTRRSAGKMLRALASHDAGSRAYVLLSLSQQDGIELHMDFDNRFTLLELFAETTSSEEHGISFEGIHLPQIPGKLLFSLVKRYLCVTSLMDKLNTAGVESTSERQDVGPSSSTAAYQSEHARVQREFEFTMAMANLISELVRVMGWDRNRQPPHTSASPSKSVEEMNNEVQKHPVRSIFQPRFSASSPVMAATAIAAVTPPKKKKTTNGFKTRSDFTSRSAYVEFVQDNLKSGMVVRMLEDYEEVSTGDEGEFRYSNDGSPPVQVYWNSLSRTYWVHWHMIEILGNGSGGQAEKETQEKASSLTETLKLTTVSQTFFSKPPGGLYTLPYLMEGSQDDAGTLSRAEWWEVLFFIKKLEPKQQQEINNILRQSLDEPLTLTSEVVRKVLHYLKQNLQASCLGDLLCSHTFTKHYLNCGGAGLEDEEMLMDSSLGGQGASSSSSLSSATASSSSSASSCTMGSVSKKAKKEIPADTGGCGSETESELPTEDDTKYPDDLEEKMKGKSIFYKCCGSAVDVIVILKMLVEMIGSQPKQNAVTALLLTRSLMLKYEWRVSFATEGGVKAILCCMQEYPTCIQVQQISLAVSGGILVTYSFLCLEGYLKFSRFYAQVMMLEIFASIGSATPEGSKGLLCTIPSAIDLMLSTAGILNKFLDNYQEDLLPWHESIEPCLSSMTAFVSDREVVQQFIRFLYRLASLNKDYAVVMCRLGTKEALLKALDKHSTSLLMVTELRDLINDCEKYASLYKKMTTSVLAGCIQMVLGQIEEHRRSHQPINIPFFDVFLRNLCQGSSVELKEDKCWEKVEVSSNHHRANKLTDKNPKTYWESNGCTGSHFINIYMHKGVIIRQLTVLVASEDSSYMPARIVVLGGDDPTNINTELNTVNVAPSASHVVLLENMTRFWPIIQIRVKRCQQGGIDTRVHGFEVLGPKPTFWPVFKEQLCCRTYLFYTTKAHTWCQEILEDKNQLLQLFNKLNSALKHEQMFADRFLPDAEAAEALGRTCWEALITPIVQSITISGYHPLSWLMNDYLEKADSSKRCKSSASIFNSRVRRLTHLLVHVDTSTVDTEELKPPIKSSDSIAGIALCWQGVVQRQVKSFLDSTCSLPDFVERYRGLFIRLKNAMEELFGQHTAFVLALRQGFSAALLQLSILTAMHVSERFAQYIDKMIQESGGDSGSVDTLNQLQHFLEPMLFLSGLELANTFEHFYRYYLGDRLLGQGKMWLESAVVEHIGTCFPNRFPQQMLTNLSESEELQQEFHLYRLQQLDTNLENFEEDVSEPEEESDVKVLVLSPRCWVVSAPCYLEEPSKHFPAQLCNYLAEFTEFYANSQRMYGLTHSKPRRLQWTWLGHAELQYGSCTLYVSTLQMYILLQFNKHEDVSVEMLQQATGLSPVMLNHALKPLTGEKGILTHTGILGLNKKTLSQSSDRHGFHFLLPKQTYLNVDEDAALTLERKRNYIYCLVVQIMKNEKEMHIDNLVFKVLDSCQKQEASRTHASVRFSCSTTDVLSCIMHVINKGYLRRNEESPHIVEFLMEDPSTPRKGQAQFSFKMDVKKSSASSSKPLEDGVLEAVLFSMGRTMTQEEVKQLMQRTVQQVAGTLSLDLDRAEHLLIHCKWNVDLLIQRYTDDPDALVLAAGLKIRNPQPAPGPVAQCPVCLSQSKESDPPPMLSCMHYCCRSCWQEYLTARIEQNLVMSCHCPITDCRAQPTSKFFHNILTDKDTIAKYDSALLRGFVECCSNLTWCTNPQGCDQVLCKENIGSMGTCSKCCWSSCFSCNFPEVICDCSDPLIWIQTGSGGYAQSKHLAKLISKRCPSCQAQIEKNEGCLHMTCAKCNHGFCWRCLKPWKPTHKDYYNCSAMVSKAARQEKKFQDYNERCTFHNQAKDFAINLENKVFSINEALQMKSLTFVIDACKILAQARKVLAYSCVYSYYNQDTEKMDVMEQQTEALDLHTNALQILLEETLLQCTDLASCVRLLKTEHLNTGLELIRRIQERLVAILQHSTQDFRVGYQSKTGPDQETAQASNLANHTDANKESKSDGGSDSGDSDNNNYEDDEYDDEYVPEWHEDYDEEDIDDDDFFSDDDESENLERDFSPFD